MLNKSSTFESIFLFLTNKISADISITAPVAVQIHGNEMPCHSQYMSATARADHGRFYISRRVNQMRLLMRH